MLKKTTVFLILVLALDTLNAAPVGAGFTYQGELQVSNVPANGEFDFQFELFDAANLGASAATAIIIEDLAVSNGVFSTELDFGIGPFAGDQLWLEISVRDGVNNGGFTGLLPRQKLTAAPYALHAESVAANSVGSSEIAASSVGSSEIVAAQVQRRVGGSCEAGTYLSGINEDGSVQCAVIPVGLTRTLDGLGFIAFVGKHTSITIRADGLPIISHYDFSNLDLKVYDCSNVACSAGTARTLDSFGSVGKYTSITIRADGLPMISYRDSDNSDLKIYDCSNTACSNGTARTLDGSPFGSVGQYTSIAVRANGLPFVSYYDDFNDNLKVYDCSNTACSAGTARTLDITGNVGRYTSIAIRTDDRPMISYFDDSNGGLKVYDCSNAACSGGTARTLDSFGSVGKYTSITIRADGLPMISYYDGTNDALKLYKCSNTACSAGTHGVLDGSVSVGEYTSITIRADGLPMISYYDALNGNLRVYDCINTICSGGTVRILDGMPGSTVGKFTSIAIRTDGLPIISYWDSTNASLKIYSCGDSRCEN